MGKYEELQYAHLGLVEVFAYRCIRCLYTWLPKDVEILNKEALTSRKPPKSCARCKSKFWRSIPKRKSNVEPLCTSIARYRMYLRLGKAGAVPALYVLSHSKPADFKRVMKIFKRDLRHEDFAWLEGELARIEELMKTGVNKKEQVLETFKPIV